MKAEILEKFKLHTLTLDLAKKPSQSDSKEEQNGLSHLEQVQALCDAGAKWIQVRTKEFKYPEHLEMLTEIRKLTTDVGTILIINDDLNSANKIKADGIHLGKNDLPPHVARNVLGKNKIIGVTVNSVEDAQRVKRENVADYAGLGPFSTTTTKVNAPEPLSEETISECVKILHPIPVVLIGGISMENFNAASIQPVQGIAVSSAICAQATPQEIITAHQEMYDAIVKSELGKTVLV